MIPRFSVVTQVWVTLRLTCVTAAAVSICAMHALRGCGVGPMTGVAPAASMSQEADATAPAGHHAYMQRDGTAPATDEGQILRGVHAGHADAGSEMSLVEWCVAVLAAGLGGVLSLRCYRSGHTGTLSPRPRRLIAPAEWAGRHRAGRSLNRLSILRC